MLHHNNAFKLISNLSFMRRTENGQKIGPKMRATEIGYLGGEMCYCRALIIRFSVGEKYVIDAMHINEVTNKVVHKKREFTNEDELRREFWRAERKLSLDTTSGGFVECDSGLGYNLKDDEIDKIRH